MVNIMEEGKCFIGLEIGSSKIAAVAGFQENNTIKILSFSEKKISPSDEVLRFGVVENGSITSEYISAVLDDIVADFEKTDFDFDLDSVNINIINTSINSHTKNSRVVGSGGVNRIRQEDVDRLLDDTVNAFKVPAGEVALHCLPRDFYVNEEKTSGTLVGKFGNQLNGDFTFLTTKSENVSNLLECVNHVKAKGGAKGYLKAENIYLNAIADSCSLLNNSSEEPNPKKEGVAIVNIGAEFTEVSVFQNNSLRYHSISPMAGNNINEDLMKAFSISFEEAEMLKMVCGSIPTVVYEKSPVVVIEKKYGMTPTEIFLKNAVNVAEARLKEIAIMVRAELHKSGFKSHLLNGIVLTGGTSNFISIKEIFHHVSSELNVRSAVFNKSINFNGFGKLKNPKYSTLLGLVMAPAFDFDKRVGNRILTPSPIINKNPLPRELEVTNDLPNTEEKGGSIWDKIGDVFRKNNSDLNDNYN
jgi:cell division protein FtsA